jgi:iron(III)-salmochelin esterase
MRFSRSSLPRRGFLLGAGALACSREEAPAPSAAAGAAPPPVAPASAVAAEPALLPASERTLEFPATRAGKISVVVWLPERRPDEKLPLLIALHGRGEALKGPERGARGWLDDYALARASARLQRPPLTPQDFEGFVAPERLAALNAALAKEPFEGVAVACPFLPDMFSADEPFAGAAPYGSFLIDVLLPRLRAEFPLLATREATGIDGVSLGGRAAIAVGLMRPDVFRTVAGVQPALTPANMSELNRRARSALERYPDLVLRVLTSSEDHYLQVLEGVHRSFDAVKVSHHFSVVVGPHSYAFNRGPGSLEMLVFHDRVLRGRKPI